MDKGEYYCEARNEVGSAECAKAKITTSMSF